MTNGLESSICGRYIPSTTSSLSQLPLDLTILNLSLLFLSDFDLLDILLNSIQITIFTPPSPSIFNTTRCHQHADFAPSLKVLAELHLPPLTAL